MPAPHLVGGASYGKHKRIHSIERSHKICIGAVTPISRISGVYEPSSGGSSGIISGREASRYARSYIYAITSLCECKPAGHHLIEQVYMPAQLDMQNLGNSLGRSSRRSLHSPR